ncbi:TonB-dependent receptor [Marinomonas mediterranea]|jgi:Outer membrane receptor proteins, mostly Fe transport|uniref:TonB-dependent receptor n=1 Tax=Marinomonas mediterranea (strain ATCC 700492 / JCM 21426 / NBRC 103028 / MMB-1) TaxID=717774 RepID=F2JWF3_MARM1|nr:TonB-dependent receptor [Marinomonas mediterranea]ADZ90626.1 TonB-dependent receptor [Marinomonas mediterranea MMB-1]WCN08668.1 TonB-dependent receptor [Marinomonas mediterranea]WCN12723.1 TonB-dependent receptor [Marinomonas mediterranea]WCN16796.1 TonB-dependent receptor [Marinomonas mediterranea MMB-1]
MALENKARNAYAPSSLSLIALSVIGFNSMIISSTAGAEEIALDTLVVTGEKIDKDIKDTTTAVTVVSGEDIENGDAKTINDVVTQSPNVVTAGFGTVNIRGINGSGATTGYYATVSGSRQRIDTSVDGVSDAFTGYNFNGSGVWDLQQVEVLRGPQSTTQGENSIGGAIVVKSNNPTFYSESAARLGLETYENGNVMKNLAVMNSGAITDNLAYRIVADGTDGKGFLSYDGETDKVPVDPEESNTLNLRGKLLWMPTSNEDFTIKLTANHRKADGSYLNWANWKNGSGNEDETFTLNESNYDNTRIQDSETNNLSVEVNYPISKGIASATTISTNSQKNRFDQYPEEETYTFKDETNAFESKLLYNAPDSNLSGVAGIMVADRDNTLDNVNTKGKTSEERAGFYTDVTYKLTQKFAFNAGGRFQYEKQSRYYKNRGTVNIDKDMSDDIFLPKIGASYVINDSTNVGFIARKGYNSGGIGYDDGWRSGQGQVYSAETYEYKSETVHAYELSSKTQFDNGSSVRIALFYNKYSDYQALSDSRIRNVSSAHTTGLEMEATQRLNPNLELRQSIGYLESEIDKNDSYKGNELSNAPNWNAAVGVTALVGDNLTINGDATYVGESYSDLSNTEDYTVGNYTLLDASADYEIGDFTISAYVKNLTDEDVVYTINAGSRAAVGQTRTVGVSATYRM